MHQNTRSTFAGWAALASFAWLPALGLAASPESLIQLSAPQAKAAGIVVEAVISPAAASDARTASGLRLSGQVVTPGDSTEVTLSTVAGQVEAVLVQIGESVRAGQPLVRVFSSELAAMQREYLHARSEEQIARSRLERDESLLADGIISESRAREARAAQEMALATLQEQRRMLQLAGYSSTDIDALTPKSLSSSVTIRARMAAVVLNQGVTVGQRVEPGTELFRLAQGGRLWLDLHASAQQAGAVNVGDAVSVAGCTKPGSVIAVGSQLNASSQTASVRAEIPDATSCLRVNQFVEADVRQASAPPGSVGVPAGAVVRNGDRHFVFVQEGAGFRPVVVRVARADGARVWVQGALPAGAKVASRGLVALKGAWLGLGPQPAPGGTN
jgi:RND family efflux transporter MFP subunit